MILRIHLSRTLLAAIDSAARASCLSRSKWIRYGLDAAAGIDRLPDDFRGAGLPDTASAEEYRDADVTLRATEEQKSH